MKSEGRRLLHSDSLNSSTQSLNGQEVESILGGATNGKLSNGSSPVVTEKTVPMSPADLHGMWYPTVRKTLICLSKLSRCIDVSTLRTRDVILTKLKDESIFISRPIHVLQ